MQSVLGLSALMVLSALMMVELAGCAADVEPGPSTDGGADSHLVLEWRLPDIHTLPADTFVGSPDTAGPCDVFKTEGQSCGGGQTCPGGQQPMLMPEGGCRCRISCNPSLSDQCGGRCGYDCVQIVDAQGKGIPGVGACLLNEHANQGESCSPGVCKTDYACVGPDAHRSFCRSACTGPSDCTGYKMVCVKLQSTTTKVCIPGGSETGPGLGQPCPGAEEFCSQDTICDPLYQVCVAACNTDDGNASPCGAGKSCQALTDPGTQVLLGFGCR